MDRRRGLALACLVAVVALSGCTGSLQQTEVICDDCVSSVENATGNVSVDRSVTHVRIQSAGDATVTARLRLNGSGVEEIDQTELDAISAQLEQEERAKTRPAFQRETVGVRLVNETLVIEYDVQGIAHRSIGGTLVVDWFYRADGEGREGETDFTESIQVETDRLVISGPEGTTALVVPPEKPTQSERVVWNNSSVPPRTYLVFGTGSGGQVIGQAAVALDVIGWVVADLWFAIGVLTVAVGGVSLSFARTYPTRVANGWLPREDGLLRILVAVTLALIGAVVVILSSLPGVLVMGVIGIAALLVFTRRYLADGDGTDSTSESERQAADRASPDPAPNRPRDSGTRFTSYRPAVDRHWVVGLLGGGGVALALTALVAMDYRATAATETVQTIAVVTPLLTFPLLGYLVTRPEWQRLRATAVTLTASTPWLAGLSWAVEEGGGSLDPFVNLVVWGAGVWVVGPLAFYGVLWVLTRRG